MRIDSQNLYLSTFWILGCNPLDRSLDVSSQLQWSYRRCVCWSRVRLQCDVLKTVTATGMCLGGHLVSWCCFPTYVLAHWFIEGVPCKTHPMAPKRSSFTVLCRLHSTHASSRPCASLLLIFIAQLWARAKMTILYSEYAKVIWSKRGSWWYVQSEATW